MWTIVTQPTDEPVSVIDLADQCRVEVEVEGDSLAGYITAARQWVEARANRTLMPTTIRLTLDHFPGGNLAAWRLLHRYEWDAVQSVRRDIAHAQRTIFLPRPPTASVSSITYVDATGATQTLDPSTYLVVTDDEPARITAAYGADWPVTRDQAGAVQVTYLAGYANAAGVPAAAKLAIKIAAAYWFNNRDAALSTDNLPIAVDTLIASFAVPSAH